jgi:hypothetical protein
VGADVGEEGGSALQDLAENCLTTGGQSFSAGSQVVLASGATVAISQLWPGAQVLATDPRTGKTQAETVDKVWVNHDTDLMDVVVRTAAGTGTVDSTAHHLFWDLTTKAWTEADQLRTGDRLWTPDGRLATVTHTLSVPGAENMLDLTVANDHDLYVVTADTSVLVHNCPDIISPRDATPEGWPSTNAWGNAVWGKGPQEALDLIGTRTPDELRALGLDADRARGLANFYQNAAELGQGGETAPARVALMQHIADLLSGDDG